MDIKIKKLKEDSVIPTYSNEFDSGFDFVAISREITDKYIEYGTGLSFEIPKGHTMLIFTRSSVSKKDLIMANSVGVIDSGYRGEILIRFKKIGEEIYEIGERIAQGIILPIPKINFIESQELEGIDSRGENGFGSSGNK
jgi:dUTP pyrophosphatase